jgi:hypothetical protein
MGYEKVNIETQKALSIARAAGLPALIKRERTEISRSGYLRLIGVQKPCQALYS